MSPGVPEVESVILKNVNGRQRRWSYALWMESIVSATPEPCGSRREENLTYLLQRFILDVRCRYDDP